MYVFFHFYIILIKIFAKKSANVLDNAPII